MADEATFVSPIERPLNGGKVAILRYVGRQVSSARTHRFLGSAAGSCGPVIPTQTGRRRASLTQAPSQSGARASLHKRSSPAFKFASKTYARVGGRLFHDACRASNPRRRRTRRGRMFETSWRRAPACSNRHRDVAKGDPEQSLTTRCFMCLLNRRQALLS